MNKRDPFTLAKAFLDVLKDEQAWREEQLGELGAKYFSDAMEYYEDELAEVNGKIVEINSKIADNNEKLNDPDYEENEPLRLENESFTVLVNDYAKIREGYNVHLEQLIDHYKELTGEKQSPQREPAIGPKSYRKQRLMEEGIGILQSRIDNLGEIKKPDSVAVLDKAMESTKRLHDDAVKELKETLQEKNTPKDIITNEVANLERRFNRAIREHEKQRNDLGKTYDEQRIQKYKLEQRIMRSTSDLKEAGIEFSGPKYRSKDSLPKPKEETKKETAEQKKTREEKEQREKRERRIKLKNEALTRLAKRAFQWEKQGFIPGPKYKAGRRATTGKLDRDYSKPIKSGKYKGITLKGDKVELDANMTKLVSDYDMSVNELIKEVNKLNPLLNVSLPDTQDNIMYTDEEISSAKTSEQKVWMKRMNDLGRGKGRKKVKQIAGNLQNWKDWKEEFSRVVSKDNLQEMRDQLNDFFENLDPEIMRLFDKDAYATDSTQFGMAKTKEDADGNIKWSKHVSRKKTLEILAKIFREAIRDEDLPDDKRFTAKKILQAIDSEIGKKPKEAPKVATKTQSAMMEMLQDMEDEVQILLESDTTDEWKEEPVEQLEELTEDVAKLLQDMDEQNPSQEDYINLLIRYHLINITIRALGKDLPNRALNAKEALKDYLETLESKYKEIYGDMADNELQSLQRLAQDSTDSDEDKKKLEQEIRRTSTRTSWKPPEGYYDDEMVRRRERVKLHKEELKKHIAIFKRYSEGKDVNITKPIRHPDQTDEEYERAKRKFTPKTISGKNVPKKAGPRGKQKPLKQLANMVIPKFKIDMDRSKQRKMYGKLVTQEDIDGERNLLISELHFHTW